MDEKTNVMRLLEQKKIKFQSHHLELTEAVSGVEMAAMLGQNPSQVFKTLVTVGKTKTNYVFVIPVNEELDLKKAPMYLSVEYAGVLDLNKSREEILAGASQGFRRKLRKAEKNDIDEYDNPEIVS